MSNKSMYFIGRRPVQRPDGKIKVQFFSRHRWPWHQGHVIADTRQSGWMDYVLLEFELWQAQCIMWRKAHPNPVEVA